MGKLIVIEGLDGSGKSTQLDMLYDRLVGAGVGCRKVSFPDYEHESSTLIKMYLAGEFGTNPHDVNAYAASTFYAVDRYASFKKYWGDFYNEGGVILAGRYVTSNAVHQCSKLEESAWQGFLEWLYDFEYNKIGIPAPDKVLFLDMPVEISQKLLSGRYSENGGHKDIHESDVEYLNHCRKAALYTAEYSHWQRVNCGRDGLPRTIEDINDELFSAVKEVL